MDWRLLQADELGIRLEIVGGLPIWEAAPVWKHQKAIDRIRESIEKLPQPIDSDEACACIHIRKNRVTRQVSPVTIDLECGCRCTV
jgi:hypothetical protein